MTSIIIPYFKPTVFEKGLLYNKRLLTMVGELSVSNDMVGLKIAFSYAVIG